MTELEDISYLRYHAKTSSVTEYAGFIGSIQTQSIVNNFITCWCQRSLWNNFYGEIKQTHVIQSIRKLDFCNK